MSKQDDVDRAANRSYRLDCQRRVNKSKLPPVIKATLHLILDHIGSPSHYTVAWVSHATLADVLGVDPRTVRRHCKAIHEGGLLVIEKLGLREAKQRLAQFGGKLGPMAHRLSFYRINRDSPFWAGQDGAATTKVNAALPKRKPERGASAAPRARACARGADGPRHGREQATDGLEPDSVGALEPDSVGALEPDSVVRQPLRKETPA